MGADIYLRSVSDAVRAEWQPKFSAAVAARDAKYRENDLRCPEDDPLQVEVTRCYDKLFSEGYFRDSYNSTSLFHLLGLSWWREDGIDSQGHMHPPAMLALIAKLESKTITDEMMSEWARHADAKIEPEGDNSIASWKKMFVDKQTRLIALLKRAVELNEPLYCSV